MTTEPIPVELLMVDPRPEIREGIERLLGGGDLPCRLHVLKSQDEAVAWLARQDPHGVVVLDWTAADRAGPPIVAELHQAPLICLVAGGSPPLNLEATREGRCWHFLDVQSGQGLAMLPETVGQIALCSRRLSEVRQSEARFRLMVDTAPHGIQELDTRGIITFANAAYHRMHGCAEGSLIGMPVWEMVTPDEAEPLRAWLETLLREQPAPVPAFNHNRTKDGRIIEVQVDWDYKRDNSGRATGFVSVITDITQQRRAEEQVQRHLAEMAHMARLSTMGEMVAGLAHELNQPLTAIANFARASRYRLRASQGGDPAELADALEQIAGQADRAGEIIRHLRDFVRRADSQRSPVDVNGLVRRIAVLLEVDARLHDTRLELALDAPLPEVIADRVQIEQVVANLVRNAMEAMDGVPAGRRVVTISTGQDAPKCVEICVEDRGSPADGGDFPKWFEPYYTTKPDGMGLGLSISRSIVQSHGGRLVAEPRPEGGTAVRVCLPVAGEGGAE